MTVQDYENWTSALRRHPQLTHTLLFLNKILTRLIYVLYPLLLVYLALQRDSRLLRVLLVPAVSFVLLSLFRSYVNAPRPYEALEIQPLIHKSTKGHSFPSRHVFSVAAIAWAYGYIVPWAGIVLTVLAVLMAYIRVLGGVHFPRDVIAGLLVGELSGIIGFVLV
ncbi:MAG: phosphatase PAP2 family protein [Eubacteriales bacterium]|nr:phosphatase PAP2 family protein [Eubacteriales bacterium]